MSLKRLIIILLLLAVGVLGFNLFINKNSSIETPIETMPSELTAQQRQQQGASPGLPVGGGEENKGQENHSQENSLAARAAEDSATNSDFNGNTEEKITTEREKEEAHIAQNYRDLFTEHGLRQSAAHELIKQANFAQVFDLVRNSEREHEAYAMEDKYQELLQASTTLANNEVYLNDFACDNQMCFAAASYQNDEAIDEFLQEVFLNSSSGAVGIITQAVSVAGAKEKRMIVSYKKASIVIGGE